MTERLKSIDLLRGLAASAVVLRHSDDQFLLGSIGVDFFFVISGFVMAQLYRQRSASQFLFDRAWRIFPIYLVALLPWLILRTVNGSGVTAQETLASVLLIPQLVRYDRHLSRRRLDLVVRAAVLRWRGTRDPASAASFSRPAVRRALLARPYVDFTLLHFLGSPMIFEFLFGVAIAVSSDPAVDRRRATFAGALWLLFFPNTGLEDYRVAMSYGPAVMRVMLWGLPAAAMVYGMLTLERAFKGRAVDALLVLGAASYSIYLVHTLVTKNIALWWPAEFLIALAVGIGLWWAVERPLLALKPKLFGKRRTAATR